MGYETLLFIHILGAFAVVAGLACVTPLVLGADVGESVSARLITVSRALFGAGGLATLLFGFWLVADRDYELFKLWIVGALGLWLVAAATGNLIKGPNERAQYSIAVVAVLAIVVLMLWKPGA
ncbi:MAG TPA: hypothetical protein VNT22_05140 [Baekduia sp.]|nr:hypothetical protein [Baekduia sp.]